MARCRTLYAFGFRVGDGFFDDVFWEGEAAEVEATAEAVVEV